MANWSGRADLNYKWWIRGTTCLPASAAFRGCVGCRWNPGNSDGSELATIDCRAGVSDTP